ncbi:hypothetical protein MPDQ_003057 [Monascus purpureus]|uniref:Amino acid permease/ SLC12A domain-containing protein n=1 Tax=Monascus purpureus TaxID=5098 RepID=A0A507R6U1_MONPU|nr:hypothetical protein MPDQ_003057 [Monascus purpureus]BDD59373.1 hypothetical protein MAP00_004582 [Monascus purpureus]
MGLLNLKSDTEKTGSSEESHDVSAGQYTEDNENVEEAQGHALKKDLQGRHMQMIAIGGAIGAGLFVGSGSALSSGGPGSVLVGYLIVSVLIFTTVLSLGELAIMYPVNGAFFEYSVRFIDPSWGFAMGWIYTISWLITLPYELSASALTIGFWHTTVNIGVFITVFLVVLIGIQFFGVRGYGEVEFLLAVIKILACIGLIILGIIINCGGVPTDNRGYIGGRYWRDPGAFRHGFKGFCAVFVNAIFSFNGTEMVGLAAAEAADPRKSLPKAVKQVFWRITIFYIVNLLIVGLNIPSDDSRLLNASNVNVSASPFVLAIQEAGIPALPSIINAVVLISVISVANSSAYGSTRTLQALALTGRAPRFFAYVDKKGRPIAAVILQVLFGFLAYINCDESSGDKVFTWLMALGTLSSIFVFTSVNVAHFRFRRAMKLQGRSFSEIPWKSPVGTIGSFIGSFLGCLCLVAVFYSALYQPRGVPPDAETFFENYLSAPIVIALFVGWKIYKREWSLGVNLREVDLDYGRRYTGTEHLEETSEPHRPIWKRVLNMVF